MRVTLPVRSIGGHRWSPAGSDVLASDFRVIDEPGPTAVLVAYTGGALGANNEEREDRRRRFDAERG